MAEGFARQILGDEYEIFSAGVEAHGLNALAADSMKEIGIDISGQHSKTVDEVPWKEMDIIITLCGHAAETCPTLPVNATLIHWDLDDPAKATGSESEVKRVFRTIRNDIKTRVERFREGERC
jgi:arsenate reductase